MYIKYMYTHIYMTYFSILAPSKWHLIVVLTCISLGTKNVECLFTYFLSHAVLLMPNPKAIKPKCLGFIV